MVKTDAAASLPTSTERGPAAVDIHVGARVRMRRRTAGLTQQALADALGLTFQQVQKYERGANRISASKLYEIARFLSSPVSYFFEGLTGPEAGEGEDQRAQALEQSIRDFLRTPEGLELARLYPHVHPPQVRRRMLDLVRTLAEVSAEGA